MDLSRRNFFSSLGQQALDFVVPPVEAASSVNHSLVFVSLRGGMDGLNTIVPFGDPGYYEKRPRLAISKPGQGDDSAINLDGYFGLNPALSKLKSLYNVGDLAIIHAAGAPFVTRSHFDARLSLESAYGYNDHFSDGWLGRYLSAKTDSSPFRAIAVKTAISQALRGTRSVTALSKTEGFDLSTGSQLDFSGLLNNLYADRNDSLGSQGRDTLDALSLLDFYEPEKYKTPDNIKYPKSSFGESLSNTAKYIKSGLGTEVFWLESGGWDHHDGLEKKLSQKLTDFSEGLSAFHQDMGAKMQNVTVIVMSEFGRRVRENASLGTDHGRGGCMFVLGKNVNGGRVHAQWPGLADDQLNKGDLEITTDYRIVLSEFLRKRMGNVNIRSIFPDFDHSQELGLFF
ncbi:MAG: DUF1501 domain-containing protein [Gammaproteobacteria bacterium]